MRRGDCVPGGERGQTLVFTVVMFAVVFSFLAVVIDSGSYLYQRREMQGVADAAAMAAIKELPVSSGLAEVVARDYVENQNSDSEGEVNTIDVTGGDTVRVVVEKDGGGAFLQFFGVAAPTIRGRATAELAQLTSMTGSLPFGIMRDAYTIGLQMQLRDDASERRGMIYPNYGNSCTPAVDGDDDRYLIKGEFAADGKIACSDPAGTVIQTASGWKSGNVKRGFDDRLNGNTDSFTDVFELDAASGKYIVKKPDSPRIATVPVIENSPDGTTTWDKNRQVVILRYLTVYIGKIDSPTDFPPYTNNGKEVWMTPVELLAPPANPKTWQSGAEVGEYDPDLESPIVYRLID